jgi:hypothetical protein
MRLLSVGVVLLCLGIGGCVPTPPTNAIAKDDPFRPYREVETEVFRYGAQPGVMALKLVAQIDRQTGTTVTLIKVHHAYQGKHRFNYESARNIRAEPLKFTSVARYGGCREKPSCPLDEMYTVEMPEADLRASAAKGYALKVFPRTGPDMIIMIPPEMIASLSALLDKERARGPAARKA